MHVVGLSVLSGSHLEVVPAVVEGLRAAGVDDVPVVVGGIIPPDDAAALRERGVAAVFTPKDYRLTAMMDEIVTLIRAAQDLPPEPRATVRDRSSLQGDRVPRRPARVTGDITHRRVIAGARTSRLSFRSHGRSGPVGRRVAACRTPAGGRRDGRAAHPRGLHPRWWCAG